MLTSTNQSYWQRQYADAIDTYNQAAAAIYAIIDPAFVATGPIQLSLPSSPSLFQGLLSGAAEYLNVLPVNQPTAAPHTRIAIDTSLLSGTAV